ncbi:MAG: hypothetical protein IJ214_08995 [Clostridia bacterium]|nr:hypothetical protein [Clostridia bacterium]
MFKKYRYHTSAFDRPGFQSTLNEIDADHVAVFLTKALSHLGRNSTMTGVFINITFAKHDVRYIAIHICYNLSEFIPLSELMTQEMA